MCDIWWCVCNLSRTPPSPPQQNWTPATEAAPLYTLVLQYHLLREVLYTSFCITFLMDLIGLRLSLFRTVLYSLFLCCDTCISCLGLTKCLFNLIIPLPRLTIDDDQINCQSGSSNRTGDHGITVRFGGTERHLQGITYHYTPNPNITRAAPSKSFLRLVLSSCPWDCSKK